MASSFDPASSRARDCLAGGGEMGALMRSVDWAATPLGAVETWPQSLRTAISMMLESRFAMVVAWGPDYRFFYNDRYRPILGTKHPASLGTPGAEIFPEIWDIVGPEFDRVRRGESFAIDDWLLPLDRNGFLENCWFTLSYSPIRDESGGVGGLLAVVVETTARVVGERQLKTLRELAAHASGSQSVEMACERALATLRGNPDDVPFASIHLFDGEERWPEAAEGTAVVPIAHAGGGPTLGALVMGISPRRAYDADYRSFFELIASQIATAVTNARAYEAERERAEALAQIDRAKTAFFSNVSHEFRTPLTLMLGPTEAALGAAEEGLRGAALEMVHRNQLRLLKLVNALLDFSRIEAGRATATYRPTDISALTRELAGAFQSAVESAGLGFEVACEPVASEVYVDRDMWEKVVLNLLSNAFKFTFDGGIRVGLAERGGQVELTVQDSGTGIAADELPRVFDRFHRIEGARSRTHEGSGIGLALTSDLVRLHGGTIGVTSTPGVGSTFTVRIPTGRAHLPAEHVATEPGEAHASSLVAPFTAELSRWVAPLEVVAAPSGSRRRILVADDNADMRDYLRQLLRDFDVEAVANGALALERARATRPDLILADVMMPELDGFGLLAALRGDARTAAIPVLMLSARSGEEARVSGLAAGADDYVTKPFSARELAARVRSLLALADARRQADLQKQHLHSLFMQAPTPIVILSAGATTASSWPTRRRASYGAGRRRRSSSGPSSTCCPSSGTSRSRGCSTRCCRPGSRTSARRALRGSTAAGTAPSRPPISISSTSRCAASTGRSKACWSSPST